VVLAIVFFLGKSSADDDKKQAQDETEQVRAELGDARAQVTELEEEVTGLEESLNSLEEELGTSEEAGQILAELVTSGQAAADQLFACAQSSREFIINFFDTGTPDEGQARTADDQCAAAEDAYNTFNDALAGIEA
jgi:septal ring factor EnvC (AmiA/AmiB activator)